MSDVIVQCSRKKFLASNASSSHALLATPQRGHLLPAVWSGGRKENVFFVLPLLSPCDHMDFCEKGLKIFFVHKTLSSRPSSSKAFPMNIPRRTVEPKFDVFCHLFGEMGWYMISAPNGMTGPSKTVPNLLLSTFSRLPVSPDYFSTDNSMSWLLPTSFRVIQTAPMVMVCDLSAVSFDSGLCGVDLSTYLFSSSQSWINSNGISCANCCGISVSQSRNRR